MNSDFQHALAGMTYGIYVLTSHLDGEINGMIASWVSQVSHSPPLIMAAIHPHRYSHAMIEKGGAFALHILDRRQTDFLKRFKGPHPASKFDTLTWTFGKTGCPILEDCLAHLECTLKERLAPGNHTLFIGEVIAARRGRIDAGEPLSTLDYDGVYTGAS
jgi:flavin reductase (DIM6/NTAB) family NADH-FMN oxidoreductase RutF